MLRSPPSRRLLAILGGLLLVAVIVSGVGAHYPHDWLLENVLVAVCVIYLAATWKSLPLSAGSYVLIFLFLLIHEVGAHWTYAEVPYDAWSKAWFGHSVNAVFGFERNHFDRLIHLIYGLMFVFPYRELYFHAGGRPGIWSYLIPIDLIASTSLVYELIEWAAAVVFGGELGIAYLGTQGDVWDAHKDMAIAILGAVVSVGLLAWGNARQSDDPSFTFIQAAKRRP
jgi:putative membrane protein